MKRLIAIAAIAGAAFLVPSGSASAEPPNGGGYCGASVNGCTAAFDAGAQCGSGAGSGAFGAIGNFGDVTHDYGMSNPNGPGANGAQTGLNNSAVCGNRQGNLP